MNSDSVYPVKNLGRRPIRTGLTVLGVALAIALTMTMFSISEGIDATAYDVVHSTGVDLFVLPKDSYPLLPNFAQLFHGRAKVTEMLGDERIQAASPRLQETLYFSKAANGTDVIAAGVAVGLVPQWEGDFKSIEMKEGQGFTNLTDPFYSSPRKHDLNISQINAKEEPLFTGEMIVTKGLADKLGVGLGDEVWLNVNLARDQRQYSNWTNSSLLYHVVGIYIYKTAEPEYQEARMNLAELQYMVGKLRLDVVNRILIELEDPGDAQDIKEWLEGDYLYSGEITAYTQADITSDMSQFTRIFDQFSMMVIVITFVVSLLFITTIMMLSVREEAKDIGILKTIGFSRLSIIRLIMAQTLILGVLGFIFGLMLGYITLNILEYVLPQMLKNYPAGISLYLISPWVILRVSALSLLIGIFSGLLPAVWASRRDPITIIRGE